MNQDKPETPITRTEWLELAAKEREAFKAENASLKDEVTTREGEIERLQQENETLKKDSDYEVFRLLKDNDSLKQQCDSYRQSIETLKKDLDCEHDTREKLDQDNYILVTELSSLREQLGLEKIHSSNFKSLLDQCEKALTERGEQLDKANESISRRIGDCIVQELGELREQNEKLWNAIETAAPESVASIKNLVTGAN